MARSYAQLAAIVFTIVGVGGFLTGDAGHVVHGEASGNFDGVALHLTYARDVLNLFIAAGFAYAGFVAGPAIASRLALALGAFLLALAGVGFIVGDTASGSRSIASPATGATTGATRCIARPVISSPVRTPLPASLSCARVRTPSCGARQMPITPPMTAPWAKPRM